MLRTGFILFFALFLLGGCWLIPRCPPVHPHYGIDYNRVRDCLGIALLDTNWIPEVVTGSQTIWLESDTTIPYPRRWQKNVMYPNDTLYAEYDRYMNGETAYRFEQENFPEKFSDPVELVVYYFYRPPSSGPWKGWVAPSDRDTVGFMYYFRAPGSSSEKKVSKAKADSILHSWGLSYP